MKKAERKINNKGFSLILVIVCMTLIGVLASTILVMSVSNVQMRVVEEEASDNFYSAEEVLDEVKANVEKQANMALGDAYTLFLQKYAVTAPKNREGVFVTSLSAVLNDLFKKDFVDNYDATPFREKYLGVASLRSGISIDKADDVILVNGSESSTITIKGLGITYTGDDGYETTIKTDLVVKVTYPEFFEGNVAGPAFLDYAIITDNNIVKDGGKTNSEIFGCVYSGGDLLVKDGAVLSLSSSYLIAKNSINVVNNSALNVANDIRGLSYASPKKSGVWTQDISTTVVTNTLNINGMDCYVQDDLTIDGMGDTVTIEGGRYYGYGSGLLDNADTNSAININAKDIHLKVKSLAEFWLAGQSYISVPKGYGSDASDASIEHFAMQGESVAFKGNQAAYLMPGDCIEGVWHNPMTVAEYNAAKKLIDGCSGTDERDYSLVLSTRKAESINGDIMNLDQYLDISSDATLGDYTSRYEKVYVQYKDSTMVYIYMTFSTPNAAKKYFEEYYSINKDLVDTRMETIGRGSILIEDIREEDITATGNLVVHSNDQNVENPNTMIHSNSVATNAEVREKDYEYSGNFRNLTMSLDAGTTYYGSNDKLTECIFRFEKVEDLKDLIEDTPVNITPEGDSQMYSLYVADDMTINSDTYGLVIATGDVEVNAKFTGLIIAQGSVTIGNGYKITSAPKAMYDLIDSEETGVLKSFFKYFDDPDAGKESKEAIDIYYDNWHKN